MLPARWPEKEDAEVSYSLDNYRAPLFLDGRLYLFYEGITSLDAATGEERRREKFRVNEEGLALTDADPVFDEQSIYASGRGRVRAISRATGEEVWEAKDLGLTNMRVEKLDLFDPYDVAQAHTWEIDVLFNNAGMGECGPVSEIPIDLVRRNFEINVFAPIVLTQGFIRKWVEAK